MRRAVGRRASATIVTGVVVSATVVAGRRVRVILVGPRTLSGLRFGPVVLRFRPRRGCPRRFTPIHMETALRLRFIVLFRRRWRRIVADRHGAVFPTRRRGRRMVAMRRRRYMVVARWRRIATRRMYIAVRVTRVMPARMPVSATHVDDTGMPIEPACTPAPESKPAAKPYARRIRNGGISVVIAVVEFTATGEVALIVTLVTVPVLLLSFITQLVPSYVKLINAPAAHATDEPTP